MIAYLIERRGQPEARPRTTVAPPRLDLAGWTTRRGGTGSPAAKAEQAAIVEVLGQAGVQ